MSEKDYFKDIIYHLGFAINDKNNSEIILNYPIKNDKKNMEFLLENEYTVISQKLGTFLADFLNLNFNVFNDFLSFFMKYSLALIEYKQIQKIFDNNSRCPNDDLIIFLKELLNKNINDYKNLQEQVNMILDYCLLNPNKKAKDFTPIQRLYVLRRLALNLKILNENKSIFYSINLFSDFPGDTEREIYDFLSQKKNKVTEYELMIPFDIGTILYKSLCSILKEKVYLKICKNCGKYFIASNNSYNYCTNIAPSEIKKTCRDVGRKIAFEKNKNSDPILASYYQLYNRKAMMKSRNPDIAKYTNDFNKFKELGKKKVAQYKECKLSVDDFKNWIDKNS